MNQPRMPRLILLMQAAGARMARTMRTLRAGFGRRLQTLAPQTLAPHRTATDASNRLAHAFPVAAMRADDREFLPAAIEILESPPSPVAMASLWFICAAAAAALAWSYFGWIDIHAIAPGKIQPSGRSKVVQPLEAGKIAAVHVRNGSVVQADDLLLELDATETSADRDAQKVDLEALMAESARRSIAISAARNESRAIPPIPFPDSVNADIRQREQAVLTADLAELHALHDSVTAQLAERAATKERLIASIAAREKLIALSKERVQMREALNDRGAGSRALIIEALQQLETQMTTDASERGQLLEADASIRSLHQRMSEATSRYISEQTQKLADTERKIDRLRQELVKARSKFDRTQLRAPIAGTVQQLVISTVGQVVTGGQSLMTVVPLDGPIEIEAMILNRDIGFVEAGQPVTVKVEAFPFTRYGTVDGIVINVSRDGVDQKDSSTLGDATNVTRMQSNAVTPTGQSLVFPATIKLLQTTMNIDGKLVPLLPGMAATAEIKTGQRRIIDYLLSPISAVASRAARER